MQRACWQLTQTLLGPKVVWQRWQVRRTRMRMGLVTRLTVMSLDDFHSPGSKVIPYLANKARARSSWMALQWVNTVGSGAGLRTGFFAGTGAVVEGLGLHAS